MTIDLATSKDITKLAKFHDCDRDELVSEAWLIQCAFPELSDELVLKKVRARAIEMKKQAGRGFIGHADINELVDFVAGSDLQSMDALHTLIFLEDELERQAKIAALDSLTTAQLAHLADCKSGHEVSRRDKKPARTVAVMINDWCTDARQPNPQMSLIG